jgi:cobalamin biosynthesis protein CobT
VLSALHVNHEVLGFTEMSDGYRKAGRDNILHVFKEFNRPVTATNLREHMSQATKALKNNADGDSILHAYHRLIKQKNQRKVLIVLSDGQPACHGGDIGNFTKQVIQQIEQKSPVDIIGLGILDRSASLFYTNHRTVRDIEELPQCLISTLKDMIA